MLRNCIIVLFFVLLLGCEQHASHNQHGAAKDTGNKAHIILPTQKNNVDTVKKSLPAIAWGNVNGVRLSVQYHSPAVRGRIIWGGLVPYDQVWVTGAHMATAFECERSFRMGGIKIPAGKYAFFTIPGKEEWTVILNKDWQQHLADEYDQSADLVRLTIKPATAEHQERLMYTIDQTGERKCVVEMRWEKLCLRVPLELAH
ncbi:MAG TPA: DUF2911 domain-containing protein [Chitinophagaceae bacterium]|nr:DUF2911 domain-containing protein [Chitinophagaceae bacterium]